MSRILLLAGFALATEAFHLPPPSLARAPAPASKLSARRACCPLAVMSAQPASLRVSRRALAGLPAVLLIPGVVQAKEEDADLERIREGCDPSVHTKHTTSQKPAAWCLTDQTRIIRSAERGRVRFVMAESCIHGAVRRHCSVNEIFVV